MTEFTNVKTEDLETITNEFGHVAIRLIETPKGERLEIEAPKLGQSIRLDAVALESLTWQPEYMFTELLVEDMNSGLNNSTSDDEVAEK